MDSKITGLLIGVAVTLILGAVLIAIISEQTVTKTQLAYQTDTVSVANAKIAGSGINTTYVFNATGILTQEPSASSWKNGYSDCAVTTITMKNATGTTLTADTDYTWTTDGNGAVGTLTLLQTAPLNASPVNTTTIGYAYCPDDYIASDWQRTVANMVPGFFAIAILAGSIVVIYFVMRKEGVM